MNAPHVIVVMGASGAGKTTVGELLAHTLGWRYIEGDDFHPQANVEKMASGHALDDADRAPWLARLRDVVRQVIDDDGHAVLACSALREAYRAALVPDDAREGDVRFVLLDVPPDVLRERVAHRAGHFMPPSLVSSQLATLEKPRHELIVDGTRTPAQIVTHIADSFDIAIH